MNKAVRTRVGAAMAGAVLLVGGLTACGGDKAGAGKAGGDGKAGASEAAQTPAEAVKASYLKTVKAGFAKAELSTAGADGKTTGQSGTKGWYPSTHDITLTGGEKPHRSTMIGDTVYTQMDKPVDGKTWMRIDLAKDGKPGVRLNEDPAEYLAMLLGQEKLTLVGTEKAGGTETRHFKAVLTHEDLLKADESGKVMEQKNRDYLHEAVKHLTAFEADVWIGADGYPVRVDAVSTDKDGASRTTAKFSDYGSVPAIAAPAADDVISFDDLMKGSGS
ncbi:hypothetical protein OG982_17875 [Streptomyces sp. NBC_01551]|uniref:hypothetical protein n=1 Tax=Streptomyces sp. NBC_01551 TaxID=2975876 RepID=UPI002254BCB0|nr:hypothetical protein [Streptomyces sp. NBC_01551]MCX4527520.1 hypothetical protein [Streptomyces sp. NBC_01551]